MFRAIQELGSAVPGLSLSLVLDGAPIHELREAIRTLKDDLDLITGGNIYFDQNKRCHNYVYGRDRNCNDSKLDKCLKLAQLMLKFRQPELNQRSPESELVHSDQSLSDANMSDDVEGDSERVET